MTATDPRPAVQRVSAAARKRSLAQPDAEFRYRPIADLGPVPLGILMTAATRASWKALPLPRQREHFALPLHFSDADAERMRLGHVPEDMDDKWFIFFENDWLYFHRSWTGHCIYGVQLDGSPSGVRVVDAWASHDQEDYNSPGAESEIQILQQLIMSRLLP